MKLSFKKDTFLVMLPKIIEYINTLEADKTYEFTVDTEKRKRSNDANAYYWQLVGMLSEKLRIAPLEIYQHHIRDVGGNYEIVPIREEAVDAWTKAWQSKGMGWMCSIVGESKLRGFTNVACFFGSSTYNTNQMSRLIDLCVQDCKEQGIETMSPAELESLKGAWKSEKQKS